MMSKKRNVGYVCSILCAVGLVVLANPRVATEIHLLSAFPQEGTPAHRCKHSSGTENFYSHVREVRLIEGLPELVSELIGLSPRTFGTTERYYSLWKMCGDREPTPKLPRPQF